MGTVIQLSIPTLADVDPDKVLEGAKGKLSCVLVAGFTDDGEVWLASSTGEPGTNLWLMEKFKQRVLED